MYQYLLFDEDRRYSPLHAVLVFADGVHEFIPDESNTYVVHVGKGRYHKTKRVEG